jgi:lysophospholipase L1-like esterase
MTRAEPGRAPRTVLCFGDSNTWGYVPGSGARHDFGTRWSGVLQSLLGEDWRVVEEGLNGRTTVFDEPFRDHRNARRTLPMLLESHAPLDAVIVMLGTNDLKRVFNAGAADAARGAGVLLAQVRASGTGPGGQAPRALLVAPPRIAALSPMLALQFADDAPARSREFGARYREVAAEHGVQFLDAGRVVEASRGDGVHLDGNGHTALAQALAAALTGADG